MNTWRETYILIQDFTDNPIWTIYWYHSDTTSTYTCTFYYMYMCIQAYKNPCSNYRKQHQFSSNVYKNIWKSRKGNNYKMLLSLRHEEVTSNNITKHETNHRDTFFSIIIHVHCDSCLNNYVYDHVHWTINCCL